MKSSSLALVAALALVSFGPRVAVAAQNTVANQCAALDTQHRLTSSPLEVQPVTVRFERFVDIQDNKEHERLIMFFYLKNTSEHAISQISGRATLKTAGIERSESDRTWGLQPNSGRNEPVDVMLQPGNRQDMSLANVPLDQFKISWVTECVLLNDGSMYLNPDTGR